MFSFGREEIDQAERLLTECVEIIKEKTREHDLIDRVFANFPGTELTFLDRKDRVKWIFKIVNGEALSDAQAEIREFRNFIDNAAQAYQRHPHPTNTKARQHAAFIGKLGKIACLRYFLEISEEEVLQDEEAIQDPEILQRHRARAARQIERLEAPPELTNDWLKGQIGKLLVQELKGEKGALLEGWWERELVQAEQAKENRRRLIGEGERRRRVRQEPVDFFHVMIREIEQNRRERIEQERRREEEMQRVRETERVREQERARRWTTLEAFISLHNIGKIFLDRPQRSFKEKILFYLNISPLLPLLISFWQVCKNTLTDIRRYFSGQNNPHSIGSLFLKSLGLIFAFLAGSIALGALMLMSLTSLPLSLLCDAIRSPQGCRRDNNGVRLFCVSLIMGIDLAKDVLLASYLLPLVSLKWLGISLLCTTPLAAVSIFMKRDANTRGDEDRPMNGDIPRGGDEDGFPFHPPYPGFHHQYRVDPLPPIPAMQLPPLENEIILDERRRRPRAARRLHF